MPSGLHFADVLAGKLILVKMDNTSSVHYVNQGTGRIPELADLAKTIRLKEVAMGSESVAVHIPGVRNITADALSRVTASATHRDQHPDRTLLRKHVKYVQSLLGQFEVDGMAAEDGHNALAESYYHPSCSLFEQEVSSGLMWVFPPDDMIDMVVTFLCNLIRARAPLRVALLVPERSNSAPWFWKLKVFKRSAVFEPVLISSLSVIILGSG